MRLNRIKVGEEILSYCGKCKLALAHVVVALKDNGMLGKCECKTCNAVHLYKDPDNMGKKKTTRTSTPKEPKIPNEQLWQNAVAKAKGEIKPYFMSEIFKAGDLIEHPSFGKGVVELVIGNNKIQALFEHDVKMLACAR